MVEGDPQHDLKNDQQPIKNTFLQLKIRSNIKTQKVQKLFRILGGCSLLSPSLFRLYFVCSFEKKKLFKAIRIFSTTKEGREGAGPLTIGIISIRFK